METLNERGLVEEIAEGWRQAPTKPDLRARPALDVAKRFLSSTRWPVIPTIAEETALTVLAELGGDLSRFATSEQFCSWLNLAPGTRISWGKVLKGPASEAGQPGGAGVCAWRQAPPVTTRASLVHAIALDFVGYNAALPVKATAHQLERLIHAMLTRGEEYVAKRMSWDSRRNDANASFVICSVRPNTSISPSWRRCKQREVTTLRTVDQWVIGCSM